MSHSICVKCKKDYEDIHPTESICAECRGFVCPYCNKPMYDADTYYWHLENEYLALE